MRKIKKAENLAQKDLVAIENVGGWREPITNAYHFITKFYKSHYDVKRNKSPFKISFEQMNKTFGEPNMIKDSDATWILKFKKELFIIDANNNGSQIYKVIQNYKHKVSIACNKNFSNSMEEFYNQLFEQFE